METDGLRQRQTEAGTETQRQRQTNPHVDGTREQSDK